MKRTTQKFPRGWKEKRARNLIEFYDKQTEADGAAEIETADEAAGATWMSVPTELVPAIAQLIDKYEQKAVNGRPRVRRTKQASMRKSSGSGRD